MIDVGAHERVAVCFSGGKDSLAVVYMLREAGLLDRVTIYHNDTGDLLPEVREIVEHVKAFAPHFVHIQGDVLAWQAAHGIPSDLVPYTAHPVAAEVGQQRVKVASRYDCCYANLMLPLWERLQADGVTLVIRGTKDVDFPRLPVRNGQSMSGAEFLHPLEGWSHAQVFDYLRSVARRSAVSMRRASSRRNALGARLGCRSGRGGICASTTRRCSRSIASGWRWSCLNLLSRWPT